MRAVRFAFAAVLALASTALGAASCANSGPVHGNTGGGGGGVGGEGAGHSTGTGGMNGELPTEICLLHNCSSDDECKACSGGKNTCLTSEHRCVACDAGSPGGCPAGQKCSSYGNCAPETATCPTDNGVPTITCTTNTDCAACDPRHQVCDPAAHKCVACTASDVSQCQSTETCNGGDCAPKCPATCAGDADCGACGAPGHEAHFCTMGQCSECSPTMGCDGKVTCGAHGTCEKTCGVTGQPKGTCMQDADCAGCDGMATQCHTPIGGGKGTCGPSAAGCSDLGQGVVLPAPFDKVTNLCSNDMDCANVGADVNVGKILRDLTGWDQIHDADIQYPMHACASVSITDDKSCGVCVPCKVDSDCQNLDIDKIAGQAFGPLGAIASAFLLDQIFGDNDHQIHMYCETVTSGYGACVPCPGLLNDCSVGKPPPDPCHDTCDTGAALDPTCGSCPASVCAMDPYCCTGKWDHLCVAEVLDACGKACESCAHDDMGGHDKCTPGAALKDTCSPCVASICEITGVYDTCCGANGGTWDQSCILAIPQYCAQPYWCDNQCHYAADCPAGQGCSLTEFKCGPCTGDSECRSGETCTNGTCG